MASLHLSWEEMCTVSLERWQEPLQRTPGCPVLTWEGTSGALISNFVYRVRRIRTVLGVQNLEYV